MLFDTEIYLFYRFLVVIFQVLGTICKRFNYTLSCSLKFVQQLKHFDHLVSVFGQAVEVMVNDYNCTAMVLELMREISRVDDKELARDTSGTRSYLFLISCIQYVGKLKYPLLRVEIDPLV